MTKVQPDAPRAGFPVREGLSWSWSLDLETLLTALSEPAPWNRPPLGAAYPPAPTDSPGTDRPADAEPCGPELADPELPGAELAGAELAGAVPAGGVPAGAAGGGGTDLVEADFADYLEALDSGRTSAVPLSVAAGLVAEILPPGPDLAGWLGCNRAGALKAGALAGAAAAYRRLGAWAQAGELAVVAQMASRSAAADAKKGVEEDGRPSKVTSDACGQVSLALTLSQSTAQWWTDLAVTLQWRLPATGAALRAGTI